jgi:antitoxin component YwqK of YwqJK toxin-antitoxin module
MTVAVAAATAAALYKEYIDDPQYVFYKELDIIIIMKVEGILTCLSEVEPKKYHCDSLKVVLMFNSEDPYKLLFHTSKYKIDETVSSYCYLSIEVLYYLYQQYYDKHTKQSEYYSKFRVANGLYQSWHYNGRLQSEVNYVDHKREGLMCKWYDNGQKDYEYNYKNGMLNGLCKAWYSDGKKMFEKIYFYDTVTQ